MISLVGIRCRLVRSLRRKKIPLGFTILSLLHVSDVYGV